MTSGRLHDVTSEAIQNFMQENQIVLGALRVQLQELHVCTPQVGSLSTNLIVGTMIIEQMLGTWVTNTIVLPEGALLTTNEVDRPTVSELKGLGINMVALPRETLYVLQDGITADVRVRESRTLQVLSEQKINMEQLSL